METSQSTPTVLPAWRRPAYGTWSLFYPGKTMQQLKDHALLRGQFGLIDEYNMITDQTIAHPREFMPLIPTRNRYRDMPVLKRTNIRVTQDLRQNKTDYINANFVDGFQHHNAYILTQGPMEATINEFWRMIWQEEVLVIIMLTRLVEKCRVKCDVYWTVEVGSFIDTGTFMVRNEGVCNKEHYQITRISLEHKRSGQKRIVKHFVYLAWPDKNVPEQSDSILKLIFHMRKAQTHMIVENNWQGHPRGPPITVHCSAGVGRSGTVVALDILIYSLDATGRVDVVGVVEKMRRQRYNSVQTSMQYIFIYVCVLHYAMVMGWIEKDLNVEKQLLE